MRIWGPFILVWITNPVNMPVSKGMFERKCYAGDSSVANGAFYIENLCFYASSRFLLAEDANPCY